jgi:hypothetical protein
MVMGNGSDAVLHGYLNHRSQIIQTSQRLGDRLFRSSGASPKREYHRSNAFVTSTNSLFPPVLDGEVVDWRIVESGGCAGLGGRL